MKTWLRSIFFSALAVAGLVQFVTGIPVIAQNVNCYMAQGGSAWTIGSGCVLNVASGGQLQIAGSDRTAVLSTAPAAIAAGYKIARGQATTASASDTVVTGLATVVSVTCTLEDSPTTDPEAATCVLGDQAGTPAAGSILVKTWKTFGGTPAAATTFTKKVNWVAIGT